MKELRWPLFAAILIVSGAVSFLAWAAEKRSGSQSAPEISSESYYEIEVPPTSPVLTVKSHSHATYIRKFTLSRETPINTEFGIELLQVHPDGLTEIRATETKKVSFAKPGECFSSGEFGRSGLFLDAAFASSGFARFTRTWCEETDEDAKRND